MKTFHLKPKILIVDDERPTRDILARALGAKYDCRTAADGALALSALRAEPDFSLVITDYRMPGMNGVELIREARAAKISVPFLMLTAYGETGLAVEAMKSGAADFVQKPVMDLDAFELKVAALAPPVSEKKAVAHAGFIGESAAMQNVYRLVRLAAGANASVLVTGPSGTGKELVARALHDLSPRAKGPFVAVECAALPATLLESELFGYEPGAFTGALNRLKIGKFEAANGGTLFLDEIGEVGLSEQVKLLRALESRVIQRIGGNADIPLDFRLVTATNRNLAERVAQGTFREDLYYRLNVIEIPMPALKDRAGDIPLLANHFLKLFSVANGGRVTGISPEAMRRLEAYDWPGNVRQLRNVVERLTVLAAGAVVVPEDLPREVVRDRPATCGGEDAPAPVSVVAPVSVSCGGEDAPAPVSVAAAPVSVVAATPDLQPSTFNLQPSTSSLADAEMAKILAVLAACGGNKSLAAEKLGISRRTVHRKLNAWKAAKGADA